MNLGSQDSPEFNLEIYINKNTQYIDIKLFWKVSEYFSDMQSVVALSADKTQTFGANNEYRQMN